MNINTTQSLAHANVFTMATIPMEILYSVYVNPLLVKRFYQLGYPLTFLFGIIGNIASILTFSREKLRRVSVGLLFIILAVSDTLVLFIYLIDIVEFGLQVNYFYD